MAERTLIRGGYVLTLDRNVADVPDGDVLVENGTIKEIGRSIEAGDAEIIDARHRIVMPGFIDTHRHTWQTPVRGILPSCTLDEYFSGMLDNIGIQYRARGCLRRQPRRRARSAQRRHHDAARLVARQQHAGSLGRGDPRPDRSGHPRRLCARRPGRRPMVVVQPAQSPRGHPAAAHAILLVRGSAAHARPRGARAGQHDARRRPARLGAGAGHRRPHQRPRRHAADRRARPSRAGPRTSSG